MKNRPVITTIALLVTGMLFASCASMPPFSSQPAFSPQTIDMAAYESKVDNFVVILDASASMDTYYDKSTRFEAAKAIVSRMNASLPNLDVMGGFRTFGHDMSVSTENTAPMFGISMYTKSGLQAGLDKVTKAGGNSPLGSAIDALNQDLRSSSGKTAVIIISDGESLGNAPLEAAKQLKKQYAERICIYTVAVGSDPAKNTYLNKLSQIGECGYATTAEKISTSAGMSGFVQDVFLMKQQDDDRDGVYNNQDQCPDTPQGVAVDPKGCALDSDNDGVADYLDKCPGTPQDVAVDPKGCPLDSDNDGVADYQDQCPDTPQGVAVDPKGCALDSDNDGVADYLDRCPGTPQGVAVDTKGCPLDSDKDGVADYLDKCPGTPRGVEVDTGGCALDSDGDGVPNDRDACPDTPTGESVDASGCPIPAATQSAKLTDAGTWLYEDIKFDTGSANIKPASYAVLAEITTVLKQNPDLKVEVQGHTDSAGRLALNNQLSSDRANSVREYLIDQGVNPAQLTSTGYGPAVPRVSNDTAEGRARNRRGELKPLQ